MNEQHARYALGIDHIEAYGSRNNAATTRGRPFAKGNPGRPRGSRHRTTLAAQALLDGEAEVITRKCIDLALEGDPTALKLCMERLVPPRKELPIEFTMPPLQSGADTTAVMVAIIQAVSEGKILLSQALDFAKLLHLYSQTASARDPDDLSALTDAQLRARILRKQAEIYDPQSVLAAIDAAFAEVDPLPSPEMPAPAAPVSNSPPQEQNRHASRIG